MTKDKSGMMNRILNYILYATSDREEYRKNREGTNKINRRQVIIYYSISLLYSLILLFLGRYIFADSPDSFERNIVPYLIAAVISVAGLVVNIVFGKSSQIVTDCSIYVLMAIIYGTSILITCNNEYQVVTILLAVIPLLSVMFIVPAIVLFASIALSNVFCVIAMKITFKPAMVQWNIPNMVIISVVSYIVGLSILITKQAKLTGDRLLKDMVEKDAMTGIYNRRSFEIDAAAFKPPLKNVSLCVLDINSLKHVNDSIGHEAGDELIIGAADIISGVFSGSGKCYRTGGDEFVVIMDKKVDANALGASLDSSMKSWHGQHIDALTISYGFASSDEHPDYTMSELLSLADKAMYDAKTAYYSNHEHERRRNRS